MEKRDENLNDFPMDFDIFGEPDSSELVRDSSDSLTDPDYTPGMTTEKAIKLQKRGLSSVGKAKKQLPRTAKGRFKPYTSPKKPAVSNKRTCQLMK